MEGAAEKVICSAAGAVLRREDALRLPAAGEAASLGPDLNQALVLPSNRFLVQMTL